MENSTKNIVPSGADRAAVGDWESEGGSLPPPRAAPPADGAGAPLKWVIGGLSAGALLVCWPLWPALVLASWTAALARPMLLRFERRMWGRRRAAAVFSLALFFVVALPLVLVIVGVVVGARDLFETISHMPSVKTALAAIAAGTDDAQAPRLPQTLSEGIDLIQRYGEQGMNVLSNVAGAAAKGLVALFIYLIAAFVFLLDGAAAWSWMQLHSPLRPRQLDRMAAAFHETGHGLLVGVGLTSVTQGLLATAAYASIGVPRWWVLGPITGVAAIIPLVGTGLVWVPISVGFFLTGHPLKGVILAVVGLAVISPADNILRPIFARNASLKMPMLALYVALFGGLAAFGLWGALLGPLLVRLLMEALVLRREAEPLPLDESGQG
jgi:predicted PurR-regulated permease PerM